MRSDDVITAAIAQFLPIDLESIDRFAKLRTRKDRKYILTADELETLLASLPSDTRVLEIDGRRWFRYESAYFDTAGLDSYRLAASRRPGRFKVRTRHYLDSGVEMAEVKTKSRRGQTIKRRTALSDTRPVAEQVRRFASEFAESAPYADSLEAVLTSRYRRCTLAFPGEGVRVTIDADYDCMDTSGETTGLVDRFIVETKTDGAASSVDRLLWKWGHRPERISKYATGLAAINVELPANRWNRVLKRHFGEARQRTPRVAAICALLMFMAALGGCGTATSASVSEGADGAEVTGDVMATVDPHLDDEDLITIRLDGTSTTATSDAVAVDGSTVFINDGGVYALTGSLDGGGIVVDVADSEDVTLVLEGVDVTNPEGSAIAVLNADEAVVVLADGSTNTLTDGVDYVFDAPDVDEPNATLFSDTNLTIGGEGVLEVDGNHNDAIASKDGLVIASGTISVAAVDDGIRGKDFVDITGGTVTVDAGGDGLKSDNDDDPERGHIAVSAGVLTIAAGDEGIQATTDIRVTGGEIDVRSTGDAVHADGEIRIDAGTLTVASGDDGIHADALVTINGGTITISESFEGIEAEVIEINDGMIDITSDDDGINVASADTVAVEPGPEPGALPADGRPARGQRGGPGGQEVVGEHYVYINGGTIVITITDNLAEQGDGIDANGHVEMTGGLVVVSGPTDTRNSALDYSGGTFTMTGGTFIGSNVDGRNAQATGVGSTQAAVVVSSGSIVPGGTVVHIESTAGEGLVTFEPANDYSMIVFSSPDLAQGETYAVELGGVVTGDSATRLFADSDYTSGEAVGTVIAALPS